MGCIYFETPLYFKYIAQIKSRYNELFLLGSGRPGFNPRLSHTKDLKNGTWYLLA